jgi:hypothetical protein
MTPQGIGLGILAALVTGCGGGGPTPDERGDLPTPADSFSARVDPRPDRATPFDVSERDTAEVVLPELDAWLLLNPAGIAETVAVQPALAWDETGRIAVVWTARQGEGSGVRGGLWAPGVPHVEVVPPTFLTAQSNGLRNEPRLCALAGEEGLRFVAAWSADLRDGSNENLAIFTRVFGPSFAGLDDPEQRLRTLPAGSHWLAALACAPSDGVGFAVAGVRGGQGAGFEVFVQRFDESGTPLGDTIVPRPSEGGGQLFPALAMSASGDILVAFEDSPSAEGPSSLHLARIGAADVVETSSLEAVIAPPAAGAALGVVGERMLVAGGTPVGLGFAGGEGPGELVRIANPDGGTASTGAAAMTDLGDGRLGVVWYRAAANGQQDVRFAVFEDGAFVADPMTLATGRYPVAYRPAIAARDGRLAIAFTESLGAGEFIIRVALARVPDGGGAP